MGRHADQLTGRQHLAALRPRRISIPIVVICLLLAGAVVLGVWWWNLRSATDPIDADPVDAYAVVVDSPSCLEGNRTTLRLAGEDPAVTATISGCGFTEGQRLAVQYLAGHPQQVRLAGTTVAGNTGLASKLLPIGILAAGLVAVLATVALLVERRRSRHLAAGSGVSVAELRARAGGAGGTDGGDGPAREDHERQGEPATGADRAPGVGASAEVTLAAPDAAPDVAVELDTDPARAAGAAGTDPAPTDTGEPAHVLPSGFVIVEEQLFTHSGTEAEPGGLTRPDGSPLPDR